MGETAAGRWLGVWVSIDAVLVLSGAVLTSYVGVTGLVRRMSLDRCLPQFLLRENRCAGRTTGSSSGFFAVCCSILVASTDGGDVSSRLLAGVYTISFLSVMALFAIGNMLLKVKRGAAPARGPGELADGGDRAGRGAPRPGRATCFMDPAYVRVFGIYFAIVRASPWR